MKEREIIRVLYKTIIALTQQIIQLEKMLEEKTK